MFLLILNDMRSSQIENTQIAGWSDEEGVLEKLLEDEKVEYYRDERWGKNYRAGGPLEWYNPPNETWNTGVVDIGPLSSREEMALDNERREWADVRARHPNF